MTAELRLAMDRSARRYDEEGRLHVAVTNISKANICPYLGREIPDAERLGLDADRVYQLLRDPAELAKAATSFNNLPLLSRHVPVTADDPQPHLVVGSTGTDAAFSKPFLCNSLVVWDASAIAGIETGQQRELSSAYRYDADMTPGEFEGVRYDGVMRNIRGNHVALVETGRAGPDVIVGDSLKELSMKLTSRKALVASGALVAYLAPRLAMDAKIDLGPVLNGVTAKNWAASKPRIATALAGATKGKLAADADISDVVGMLDRLDDITDEIDPAMDDDAETPEEREIRLAARAAKAAAKTGDDADPMPPANDPAPVTKTAMDAAIAAAAAKAEASTVARMNAIHAAKTEVRPYVGEVVAAMDSAPAVYRLALDHLGVDLTDVPPEAYRAVLRAQPVPGAAAPRARIAQDAAASGLATRFPAVNRLKHI